jgi:dihydrofolate synthase/folylpolyglutamate synthase
VLDLPSPILKKEQVDISIIEVGSGRLDANIITPLVSVITNIGLDHTHFRQHYRIDRSRKAGIIKPNVPVVIGEYTDETKMSWAKSKK